MQYPPTRISISDDPFSSATIGLLIPTYWNILKNARLGDEFIIEIEKTSGDLELMTARCAKIVTSGVPTIHFLCKVTKVKSSWNPTVFYCALDTGGFITYELVISPTSNTTFKYAALV